MRTRLTAPQGRVLAVSLLLAAVAAGVSGAGPDGAGAPCPPAPAEVSGTLLAVAVPPQQTVWAVGYTGPYPRRTVTLVEHWDGTAWARVPSPSPAGKAQLDAVAAASDSDAWAVGATVSSNDQNLSTLIEHWNGTAWTVVPSPARAVGLDAVIAISADDAWAAGATVIDNNNDKPVIEHWNGTAWRVVPSPAPGGDGGIPQLYAITAASASDAWVVGGYHRNVEDFGSTLIEHWNGRAWRQVPSPSPPRGFSLYGVAASSRGNAWAVGYSSASNDTLIEHWNGQAWRVAPNPISVYGGTLNGVTAGPAGIAWAVGWTGGNDYRGGGGVTMVVRGQGPRWTKVPSRSPGGNGGDGLLSGVAATSAGGAWAVGSYYGAAQGGPVTLIECWNGIA